MIRANTVSEKGLDMFFKKVPIKANTTYEFSFDVLGAPLNVWFNGKYIRDVQGELVSPFTDAWLHRSLTFTTGERAANASRWGISINKQLLGYPASGFHESYIDNVRLIAVDEPHNELISSGDFEAPPRDSVYDTQWVAFLRADAGALYGVELTTDPLCPENHCLKIPRVIRPPQYDENAPLCVDSYGCYSGDFSNDTRLQNPDVPVHTLLLVSRGEIVSPSHEKERYAGEGDVIYAPPHSDIDFILKKGDNREYRFVTFYGAVAEACLRHAALQKASTFSSPDIALLSTHIDQMLQLNANSPFYPYEATAHLQLLLSELLAQRQPATTPIPPAIQHAAQQLRAHAEVPVTNHQLAAEVGLSTEYFIRLFKKHMGVTPHRYRLVKLMKTGEKLLRSTNMTVQEIAYTLQLDDPYYFSRLFRSVYDMSPREYRKAHKH